MRRACLFHDGAAAGTLSINLTNGVWHCFARCGGGTWPEFIERVRRGTEYGPQPERFQQARTPVLKSLLDRGFTRPMLAAWGAEWDEAYGAMRFPMPCAAHTWYLCRAPAGVEPKYRYEAGFPRQDTLFGAWLLTPPLDRLVVVEGPLDAIWVQAAGLAAVAALGSDMSPSQVEQVAALTRRAVLCFDADASGKAGVARAAPLLRRAGVWVLEAPLPPRCKDIQDVPLTNVKGVIEGAKLRANGKGVVHPRYQHWIGRNGHA